MMKISFSLNGKSVSAECEPLARLLDVLRTEFRMTGVKEGCGEGECGACSVFLNGKIVNSCITPAAQADGCEVVTVDGFRTSDRYAAIEDAFEETGGVQCGFCTPGFVMATEALLRENPRPTDDEIREGLSGNLCRCTGYNMIIGAVRLAGEKLS